MYCISLLCLCTFTPFMFALPQRQWAVWQAVTRTMQTHTHTYFVVASRHSLTTDAAGRHAGCIWILPCVPLSLSHFLPFSFPFTSLLNCSYTEKSISENRTWSSRGHPHSFSHSGWIKWFITLIKQVHSFLWHRTLTSLPLGGRDVGWRVGSRTLSSWTN